MITTRQRMTRYGGSLAVVLGIHALAIVIALKWPAPKPIELPPQAMMVEIAPLPEPAPPPPPKVITPPTPPEPVEEVPLPKVAEAPKPEIAIPKPPPKPKPKPKPLPPKPEKKPEPPKEEPPAEKTVDTPPAPPAAPKAEKSEPPMQSNSNALPTWQSDLLKHLAKYRDKAYPESARRRGIQGTVRLRFVVDARGMVLSSEVVGESGSALLDRGTIDMVRIAQPLPIPPKELLSNGTVEVVAPFIFSLKNR